MKLPVLMHLLHTLREGWPFSKLSTFQLIKKFNKASPEKRKKESNYSRISVCYYITTGIFSIE